MAYTFKHGDRPLYGITIQRAVGRGGFGEVYYALTDSGKQVAVKFLRDNPEVELRGIAHVMNLKSPHLITIYDVRHNEDGDPFVIMEYVSGPSLRDLLTAEPNGLGPQKAAFFIKGIAQGLAYLHERGIVHRDLKPGNIFYDDGYVKIGDYGLSKHIAVSAHSGNTISVGTVHYMAPEIGSGTYSKTIDVYALGVMLYEMLTGRLPFTGSSMGEVLMRHLSDTPDVAGIPEPFAGVIAKALKKDPAERFQDVDEILDELTSVAEVNSSLASFDASVLVDTPRVNAVDDPDRTLTRSPYPVPEMDAREAGLDLPSIPSIPSLLNPKAAKKARKLEQKARKLGEKASRKVAQVRARMEAIGAQSQQTPPLPAVPGGHALAPRAKWQQFFIGLIILFAVAGAVGTLGGDGVAFGASLLFLLGGSLGSFVAYRLCKRHGSSEFGLQERILFGTTTFVFMLPAYAAGTSVEGTEPFEQIIFPLAGMFLLFNWVDRIEMGRRFVISGGTVFYHALFAWIVGEMVTHGKCGVVAGVLGAAMVVLVQTWSGLAPLVAIPRHAKGWQDDRGRGRRRQVFRRVEASLEHVGDAIGVAVDRVGDRLEGVLGKGESQKEESRKTPETPVAPPVPATMQPSFVGRTANAGLSFLAKLLLLGGLAFAVVANSQFANNGIFSGATTIVTNTNGETTTSVAYASGEEGQRREVSALAVFGPILFGSLLLVISRRGDGVSHFLRGFFGCLFAAVTAILAFGPLADQTGLFLAGNWDAMGEAEKWKDLLPVGFFLTISLLLLFWPRKSAYQGPKPIVI